MKHTPTPMEITVRFSNEKEICKVKYKNEILSEIDYDNITKWQPILDRVNSHDILVKALEDIENLGDENDGNIYKAMEIAEEALGKLK